MSSLFAQALTGTPFVPTAPATVQVHALSAGHFTLPEEQFVHPAAHGGRSTVPSLCFLVQHLDPVTGINTRIVFDLGLRRDTNRYSEPIRRHVTTRQPMTTDPDVAKSLRRGGLTPDDIDYVIYSHVHWDHVGEPRDFPQSTFVVGHGSRDLLSGTSAALRGGHSFFEADLLDPARVIELSNPNTAELNGIGSDINGLITPSLTPTPSPIFTNFSRPWRPFGHLPSTLDLFGDGSLYIVDAPGHLPGHINLLARARATEADGQNDTIKWVYLAGDACHDRRIIRGEKQIGEWQDTHGQVCCIHADRAKAEETIGRIRELEGEGVEVIFAHDVEWEADARNRERFFGEGEGGGGKEGKL